MVSQLSEQRKQSVNKLWLSTNRAEFVYYPGQPMAERIDILNRQRTRYSISVFKTHKNPPQVHIRDDVFYIVGLRSPIDVAASLRDFMPNHNVNFAKLWGGFPELAGNHNLPESAMDHQLLVDIGNGRSMIDVLDFDLIKGWWPYRNRKNVLFLHFADRLRDHVGQIKKIADFIGANLTDDQLRAVAELNSFETMKKDAKRSESYFLLEEYRQRGLIPADVGTIVVDHVNVGPKRSGTKEMSANLVNGLRKKTIDTFGEAIAKYLYEGGAIPDVELPSK